MGLPIVENLSGPHESIFSLFRGPQFNSHKNIKNIEFYYPRWANGCLGSLGLLLFAWPRWQRTSSTDAFLVHRYTESWILYMA